MGRQGRLAFMAWVSGLFSPLVSPPLTPFSVNPLFCRHPLKRSAVGKGDFYFSRDTPQLPPPLSTVQAVSFAVTKKKKKPRVMRENQSHKMKARSGTKAAVCSNRYATDKRGACCAHIINNTKVKRDFFIYQK